MESLIGFYKRTLESVGLTYNQEGIVIRESGDKKTVVLAEGKPLVLPIKEQLDNLIEIEDGERVVNKVLFNPLNEDVIKGDSLSLVKLKILITYKMCHLIYAAVRLLLTVIDNKMEQDKATLIISTYLTKLKDKTKVDDETLNTWDKIYNKSLDHELFLSLFIKKRGNDVLPIKYNRLTTASCDILNILTKLIEEKTYEYHGVKVRKKDIELYIDTIKYVFDVDAMVGWFNGINSSQGPSKIQGGIGFSMSDKHTISIGSTDNIAPAFISLMYMYITHVNRSMQILNELKDIDSKLYDSAYIDIKITIDDLSTISQYASKLKMIPNDIDLHRMLLEKPKAIETSNTTVSIPTNQDTYDTILGNIRGNQMNPAHGAIQHIPMVNTMNNIQPMYNPQYGVQYGTYNNHIPSNMNNIQPMQPIMTYGHGSNHHMVNNNQRNTQVISIPNIGGMYK